jgi:hypothetical protein
VDVAVTAGHLVLDSEGKLEPCWSVVHMPIVFTPWRPPQDLTSRRFSGSGDIDAVRESARRDGEAGAFRDLPRLELA